MWRIQSISAKNFVSFSEVEYSFDSKCFVINAINNDNSSQKSNGGGKTSFIDIIPVALFGYSLTGSNAKDLVSWTCEDGYLTVSIKLINKEHDLTCEINRKIYSDKTSSELVILVNGVVPKTIPTKRGVENGVDVKAGDAYILKEILDIKADDLLNYYLISGKYYQPFLKVNTDRKLEVIGRFTNTTIVDKVISSLESDIKILKDAIVSCDKDTIEAEGFIKALQSSLNEDAKEQFEQEKVVKIDKVNTDIADYETKILQSEYEIGNNVTKLDSFVLHEIDLNSKKELEELSEQFDTTAEQDEETELGKSIAHIKNHLAGLIICPECKHEFHLRSKEAYTKTNLTKREKQLVDIKQVIKEKKEQCKEIDVLLDEIDRQERDNKRIQSEIDAIQRTINSIKQQQQRYVKEIDGLELRRKSIEQSDFRDTTTDVHKRISGKQKELDNFKQQRKTFDEQLELKSKWVNHFSDFKFYLGNKPLQIITGLVNQYLEFMGSDLNLEIEGFKKLRSGELRQSLEPVITRNGLNPQSIYRFSAGEVARLNVATDLAFQQLINYSSKYGGLDYYGNDELMASVDDLGVASAASALNELNKTILLVTHSAATINFENTVTIEKTNGVSKLI